MDPEFDMPRNANIFQDHHQIGLIAAAVDDYYAESKNFAEFFMEKDADSLELVSEDEKNFPSVVK